MPAVTTVVCADGIERPESECCVVDNEWHPRGECVLDVDDMLRLRRNCVILPGGNFCERSECVRDYNGRWVIREWAVELVDGDWASEDDDNVCRRADGEYDLVDNCIYIDRYQAYFCADETCCCASCDSCMLEDDAYYDDGDTYCPRCWEDRDRVILEYGDRTANRLPSESRDPLKAGIELEVVARATTAEEGAKRVRQSLLDDYCVFKRDGSLPMAGFEIVTRPDSMLVHKAKWQVLFDKEPGKWLASWDNDACGMHVHISRAPLSDLQMDKMNLFLNNPRNALFLEALAGRGAVGWCKVSPKKHGDIKRNTDRYVALNVTTKTCEFRIFRGTLNRDGFFKNLEFAFALTKFCSPANVSVRDALYWTKFVAWVNRKEYPCLYAWLVERGYRTRRTLHRNTTP